MSGKEGKGFSLKDHLFNLDRVNYLANQFLVADHRFDAAGFVARAMSRMKQLELKERISHIATVLEEFLDSDFRIAARQIAAALPPPLDPKRTDDDFGDFIFAPLGEFVARNGIEGRHLQLSLKTLKMITMRFSMEDAIRTFINAHPKETLAVLARWSKDKNYHVRRLVSEGTRPRLPWSGRIAIDPSIPLQLLDTLHSDPTRYVTRSVANHLNDISKTDPQLVLETLQRWKREGRQAEEELRWITRHSLRTLVKKGHADTLQFLGFATNPKIQVTRLSLRPKRIRPGQVIEISLDVKADREETLVIDYLIDFVKANGRRTIKTHKLKQLHLGQGESTTIKKSHMFKAFATTYSLYPGTHYVTIQINGQPFGRRSFEIRHPANKNVPTNPQIS